MRYITLQEFIERAEKSNDIIIAIKRDYFDGKGLRDRCKCKSPVRDVKYLVEKNRAQRRVVTYLEWSDSDGHVKIEGWGLGNEIKDIEFHQGEYSVSCYVETEPFVFAGDLKILQ